MKKTITTIALVTAVLGSAPTSASTPFTLDTTKFSTDEVALGFMQESSGWYISASGMLVMQQDSTLQDAGGGTLGEITFDDSIGLSLAVGYDFDVSPFSVEMEFSLRSSDIDGGSLFGTPVAFAGDVSTISVMLNGFYHIDFVNSDFGMYAGAGIGFAQSTVELFIPGFGTATLDNDATWATQLMLGLTYQIDDRVQLYGGVRYFYAFDVEFAQSGGDASVNLELGIKFSF